MKAPSLKKAKGLAAILVAALLLSAKAQAATWTVCASGCTAQTITLCLASAITDTAAVIDLQANTTEAVSLAQSISELKTTTSAIWLATGGAPNLSITAAAIGQMVIDGGLTFRHTGTAGDCIVWVNHLATSSLKVEGNTIDQQTDANGIVASVSGTAASQLIINRNTLDGNSAGSTNARGIRLIDTSGTQANSRIITNNLFKRWGRTAISATTAMSANIMVLVGNNSFYQCGSATATLGAINFSCGFSAVNNLVLGGSTSQLDISISGAGACSMETNSLHGQKTPTPCGTPAVIMGVSPTNVWVNPGTDFRLLPGSQSSNAGVTVTWIPTADLNGTPMSAGNWSMGAIQNIVSSTNTVTPTFTTTPTPDPTAASSVNTPYHIDKPSPMATSRWWRMLQ